MSESNQRAISEIAAELEASIKTANVMLSATSDDDPVQQLLRMFDENDHEPSS